MNGDNLLRHCVRLEPPLWLRRLVIVESDDPNAIPIRDITFARGLNIIWAQEPDDEDAKTEISGHSAGKTSLCRLIRYVLGERQFATKNNTRLIGKAFPEGYVGAEVFVQGSLWGVIRPLKKGRTSYIKRNATVEEVLAHRSNAAFEHDYAEKIGLTSLLDQLASNTIVETDQSIKWEHLLAWCTRDQEMRFQDVFGWRSPRSESEWSAFQHPKGDALFLMRVALGLFLPEELEKEESLGKMKRDFEILEKRLIDLEREPEFRFNLYDRELRNRLKALFPEREGIENYPFKAEEALGLFPDLERTTEDAIKGLEDLSAEIEKDRKAAQDSIDAVGGEIRELESKLVALNSIIEMDAKAQSEIGGEPAEREQMRRRLDDAANAMCIYGDVLFSECNYVKARREGLKRTEIQDAHAAEQNEAKREESMRKLESQKRDILEQVRTAKEALDGAKRKRDAFSASSRENRDALRDLKLSFENLRTWTEKKAKPHEFESLNATRASLVRKGEDIAKMEQDLNLLIEKHNSSHQKLAAIFSAAVRKVLPSGTYDGQVSLQNRQLAFSITKGPSMSGEAVETLAVLLADISGLIFNARSEGSRLPGVLLHDSPREADLGKRIYWSYFRFAASLQKQLSSIEECPFQYIITTTTEPPKELQSDDWVKLRLDASRTQGLLFKRNIAEAGEAQSRELLV